MAVDLYARHFGFTSRPFSLLPDPEFLFWSSAHGRAFTVLEYGLMTQAPLTVVTGEVGTGKTTLIQALLRSVEDNITLGLISNAQGDRGDLLRWVLNALRVSLPMQTDYVSLFQHFQTFCIDEYAAGRHVVLIIDEAQNLGEEMLEELRMLTNINSGSDVLLQIILAGQPELRALIMRPALRQFAQRVAVTCNIKPFDLPDTTAYIGHRLSMAGGSGGEISQAAIDVIFDRSGGIPRIINKLCDLALVYAATSGEEKVSQKTVQEILEDGLILDTPNPPFLLTDRVDRPEEAAE